MSQSSDHLKLKLLNMTMSLLHKWPQQSLTTSQTNRAPLDCGGTGDSRHECADDKSAATH